MTVEYTCLYCEARNTCELGVEDLGTDHRVGTFSIDCFKCGRTTYFITIPFRDPEELKIKLASARFSE